MLDFMTSIIEKFLDWVLKLLPTSPFTSFIEACGNLPYLGWLNWFIPVGQMIAIGEAWLIAIGLFYLYSIVLRWIRAIEQEGKKMWFDDNTTNTCTTCRYGDKETNTKHCRKCISEYCLSGMGYTQWESERRRKGYDLPVQRDSRLGEVLAHIKGHLLDIEKRVSRACKLPR